MEHEIRRVEVAHVRVLEPDGAPAVARQVDDGGGPVGRNLQIAEAATPSKLDRSIVSSPSVKSVIVSVP